MCVCVHVCLHACVHVRMSACIHMSLHDHHSSPENCGPNGLLDVLAHPPEGDGRTQVQCHYGHAWHSWRGSGGGAAHDSPVILLLKVAHTDAPGSTANGKLVSCAQTPTEYVKCHHQAAPHVGPSMYNSAHSPCGDHLTQVAARLILKITREGFHAFSPSLYTHT